MYRYLFLFSFIFFSSSTLASDDLFSGQFSHEYTETGTEPVFEVIPNKNGFELVYLYDRKKFQLHPLSQQERNQFWKKMLWSASSNEHTQCIGDNIRVICHIPAESRQKNIWLENHTSDYFFYDSVMGVIELYRISEE